MTQAGSSGNSRLASAVARKARRRRGVVIAGSAIVALLVVGTALAWLVSRGNRGVPETRAAAPRSAIASVIASPSAEASSNIAEVPDLAGLSVDEASVILRAVGLRLHLSQEGTTSGGRPVLASQDPAAGSLVEEGSVVDVGFPIVVGGASQVRSGGGAKASARRFVVCIDPGHQAHADTGLEPIGPGSAEQKPRVTGGGTGVSTGVAEYEIALQLAMNLQDRLEGQGVQVVMTRTTNDVDVSNAERALIANKAGADLFVRIHADGSTDPAACGVSTMYPATNPWTRPIYDRSKRAARIVQASTVHATGAADDGAIERADLAGFNWSKVPSVLVEAGYLSNSVEDRLLSSPKYQDELASGMADGVMTYLRSSGR